MNKEEHAADARKWRKEHPDKVKETNKLYYQKNAEKLKKNQRIYYWNHRDDIVINAKNKQSQANYYKKHKQEVNQRNSNRRAKQHQEILELLGGKCVRCGFNDWRALQIDHVNGGGNQERKQIPQTLRFYKLVAESFRLKENKYQLLCANCNQIKNYEKFHSDMF